MKSSPLAVTGIDTHAHIFRHDLPMAAGRRYSPSYDALVEDYLAHLLGSGLSHGVLIQPSFLGTDNSFMLEAVRRYPEQLRAVVVVDPQISDAELDRLEASGTVGVRLNLVGLALEDFAQPRWQEFFLKLARRHWSVEIQRGMEDLALILPSILESGVAVVIDHFGLPKGMIDPDHSSHGRFLSLLAHEQLWIKLSATYRNNLTLDQAAANLRVLISACAGHDRFLWGSDWPHTQFEDQVSYVSQYSIIEALLPNPEHRAKVLVDNPGKLFKFA
ncbi:amidohydrolase [Pseudomonas sp. G11-1]|uniref:Amidohydrolase n=1 Tax=Halopseudomonas bauzanensis TaxID=653930 RepID=A0A1H9QAJ4_9GAMM|nr:amidohydrolase family protein [Halopseudomonas bauzanensis]MCO5785054.1 amidohydrolase [Pseudomonas sp. G11-1]MCO5788843.1 amidohydrolase [Pseudomonas sp. G11-2]TKA90760.1 amidohydrolase [Halopseudomonas bauzanensis]SER57460.1 Predicted metal-dependent hydrolase, TIM-barrel fold [Halopseudomonas bauzanensis]SFL67792.1 Predicted metal-dependent hydrolase, TIM-barrel fold [Halopseudomonas bauzanensis]